MEVFDHLLPFLFASRSSARGKAGPSGGGACLRAKSSCGEFAGCGRTQRCVLRRALGAVGDVLGGVSRRGRESAGRRIGPRHPTPRQGPVDPAVASTTTL